MMFIQRTNPGGVPGFNNTVFDIAFPDSFVDFAMFLDPNHKHRPAEDEKPLWAKWSVGQTEMLFNKTDSNEPVLKSIQTDANLLDRCRYVLSLTVSQYQTDSGIGSGKPLEH